MAKSRRTHKDYVDTRRPDAPRKASQDLALRNFLDAVDPSMFIESLMNSEYDSKYHRLAVMMQEPSEARKSIGRLSRELGVSLIDLVDQYRKTSIAMSHINAMEKLPEIVRENAVDALPTMEVCPACEGAKRVKHPTRVNKSGASATVKCMRCLGKGFVRIAGLTDAKKLIFQSEGLIESGGGKVQVNVGMTGVPNLMDAIEVQERALKLGEGKIVEAENVAD